ncbi:hypothetical protein B0H16DRAFT_1626482 [Mycena metata]|uniref:Uncharacterized protein n=1 Tax=Mycena metata TaxID=1033252 RepID=A0AAD7H4W7_9AGAR|nr:hypothetical protein B0H16DRAFT_1626482 [Mycena metata]
MEREDRRRSAPAPAPVEEAPLVLRHRRQHSGAHGDHRPYHDAQPTFRRLRPRSARSGCTTRTAPAPSTPNATKGKSSPDSEFHPQPLARPVLAETEYTPPSNSRAGALARLKKKGRMEEGLQREKARASGGGTISAFERGARAQAQATPANGQQRRLDMEDDLPAPFAAFAGVNMQVLRELHRRDVSLAISRTSDVAMYMQKGTEPSPYR